MNTFFETLKSYIEQYPLNYSNVESVKKDFNEMFQK